MVYRESVWLALYPTMTVRVVKVEGGRARKPKGGRGGER